MQEVPLRIIHERCMGCMECVPYCPEEAIIQQETNE